MLLPAYYHYRDSILWAQHAFVPFGWMPLNGLICADREESHLDEPVK